MQIHNLTLQAFSLVLIVLQVYLATTQLSFKVFQLLLPLFYLSL